MSFLWLMFHPETRPGRVRPLTNIARATLSLSKGKALSQFIINLTGGYPGKPNMKFIARKAALDGGLAKDLWFWYLEQEQPEEWVEYVDDDCVTAGVCVGGRVCVSCVVM